MKNTLRLTALAALLTASSADTATAQRRGSTPAIDSAKWRAERYVVNRDSAYADPRVGLRKLIGGNRRFVEGKSIRPRQDMSTIKATEKGQAPFAVIVGCSDSRVPNELVFDQGLGDLFIIRTAGQVAAEASYGSMEFAVLALKTKLIVVMGHTECGAVDAAIKRPDNPPGHIVSLINAIKPAARRAQGMPGNTLNNAVRQNVIEQVNNLRELDPVLSKKFYDGEILIVGAVYDVHSGAVEFLSETLTTLPERKKS